MRGPKQIDLVKKEIVQLKLEKVLLSNSKKLIWTDFLKKKSLYRPLMIAVFIKIAQHFSGINAVIIIIIQLFFFESKKSKNLKFINRLLFIQPAFFKVLV